MHSHLLTFRIPSYAIQVLTFKLLTNKPHCVNGSGFDISQGASDIMIELYHWHTLNSGLESAIMDVVQKA
jgi:hypothetical protein